MWWLIWNPNNPKARLEEERRLCQKLMGQESTFGKLAGHLAQSAQHGTTQDTPQKQAEQEPAPNSRSLNHTGIMACAFILIHK